MTTPPTYHTSTDHTSADQTSASGPATTPKATNGPVADLHVVVGGRSHRLAAGATTIVGRDPGCDLVLTNPATSRRHATIWHDGWSWVLEDHSTAGTFVGTSRVQRVRLPNAATVWFGPVGAGELATVSTTSASAATVAPAAIEVRPVTPPPPPGSSAATSSATASGRSDRPRRRLPAWALAVSILVAVGLLVSAVAAVTSGSSQAEDAPTLLDGPPPIAADAGTAGSTTTVEHLRAATVRLVAGSRAGSGAIVSRDGLILTNAHVVAPEALGQGVVRDDASFELPANPDHVDIAVSKGGDDEPAELTYEGRVIAADGYLDLAVVQITRTTSGKVLQPGDLDLPALELGDSKAVRLGAPLTILGFPGIANSGAVTLTTGAVGGFQVDGRLQDNRASINTGAAIAAGSSGGVAADEAGRLIGTPTAERASKDGTDTIAVLRPVHLAAPLIDQARRTRDQGEPAYTSPWVTAVPAGAGLGDNTLVRPAATPGLEVHGDCSRTERTSTVSSRAVGVAIPFHGFPEGLVDIRVDVKRLGEGPGQPDVVVGSVRNVGTVADARVPASGCMVASVPVPDGLQPGATHVIEVYVGGNEQPLANNGVFTLAP